MAADPKNREEGIKKGKQEAYNEGRRIADEGDFLGFGRASSKSSTYSGANKMEIDRGYDERNKEIKAAKKEKKATKEIEKRLIKSGNRKIKKASGGPVHKMPDGTMMKGAKHGLNAGGYVVDADSARRRKKFKGAKAVKNNMRGHKKKLNEGGIVDRQYLKGK